MTLTARFNLNENGMRYQSNSKSSVHHENVVSTLLYNIDRRNQKVAADPGTVYSKTQSYSGPALAFSTPLLLTLLHSYTVVVCLHTLVQCYSPVLVFAIKFIHN